MGRTAPSFSRVIDAEAERWRKFRRALRKEDQMLFDRIFHRARRNVQAWAYAAMPHPFEALVMSVLLDQERELRELRTRSQATT